MVDDGIEGQSLGEAEVEGSRSCGAFVQRNNESEGYDDREGTGLSYIACTGDVRY